MKAVWEEQAVGNLHKWLESDLLLGKSKQFWKSAEVFTSLGRCMQVNILVVADAATVFLNLLVKQTI